MYPSQHPKIWPTVQSNTGGPFTLTQHALFLVSAGTPQAVSSGLCLFLLVQPALMKFLKFHGDRQGPAELVFVFQPQGHRALCEGPEQCPNVQRDSKWVVVGPGQIRTILPHPASRASFFLSQGPKCCWKVPPPSQVCPQQPWLHYRPGTLGTYPGISVAALLL